MQWKWPQWNKEGVNALMSDAQINHADKVSKVLADFQRL